MTGIEIAFWGMIALIILVAFISVLVIMIVERASRRKDRSMDHMFYSDDHETPHQFRGLEGRVGRSRGK